MSYCVNCGVELDASVKNCPLCQTPVINPNETAEEKKDIFAPYSQTEHIPQGANRRFIAYIISMIILIPNIVCAFVNLLFHDGGYWAHFVNTTSFLIWIVFVFPFFTKKFRPFLMWGFDTAAAAAYVYFFFALSRAAGKNWYFTCALPVVLLISALVLADMLWMKKKKRHWVLKSIVILSDIGVAGIVSGALVDHATSLDFMFEIGAIVFVSCAAMAAFLIYCYTSKHMRRWLSKDFSFKTKERGKAMNKHEALSKYFGYSSFRDGQEQVIDSILSGRDTLAVMPTGAGKSVCFQIPALLFDGITIVISPLISLMKDQVNSLIQNGVSAAYLNRSLTERQMAVALQRAAAGQYKIIYAAPERLTTPGFLRFVRCADISMVCVDEAHCVSQWGQDFRPGYLKIADFIDSLPKRPVVSAFTATATGRVRDDIAKLLQLKDPSVTVLSFDRENLYFEAVKPKSKPKELRRFLNLYSGRSGIVYCSSRKTTDKLCDALSLEGYSVTKYHAGLEAEERKKNQELFVNDEKEIIIATNAFGMGIDKSNVSFVIHYNMPGDIESYYQEAGRAGRDGCYADCILMFNGSDINTQKYFIENPEENDELTAEEKRAVYRLKMSKLQDMIAYANSETCLRRFILSYFGEEADESCGNCSVCNSFAASGDLTKTAQMVLSCVVRAGSREGKDVIADILKGNPTQYITERRLHTLSTFGLMRDVSLARVLEVISFFVSAGYLESKNAALSVTEKGKDVLFGRKKAEAAFSQRKPSSSDELSDGFTPDRELFEQLRVLRKEIASSKGVPAFVVFTDATLRAMSGMKPKTRREFLRVPGVGEAKLDRYGARFIKKICAFCDEKGEE